MNKINKTWEEIGVKPCQSLSDHDMGYRTIGGFPGHEDVHPTGEQVCLKCGKTLSEIVKPLLSQAREEGRREGYSKSFNQMMGNPIKQLDKLKLRKKD